MDRRMFLTSAAAALAFPSLLGEPAQASYAVAKKARVIHRLPNSSVRRMAWTVDDGCSSRAVRKYVQHAIEYDAKLTFFVYSSMKSWQLNQNLIQPLVESGQIQLGNHTHRHKNLAQLNAKRIRREILDCHNFLLDTFGVDARPYFRPPFGAFDSTVRKVAADLGYTKLMMWSGTLADSGHISLRREMYFANRYIRNGTVLLGHANNLNADRLFGKLHRLTQKRDLELVTLADALGPTRLVPTPTPTVVPSQTPTPTPSPSDSASLAPQT